MKLPIVSNEQLVKHYKRIGILSKGEGTKVLVERMGNGALMVLVDGNNRDKKQKQPALSLKHNGELIKNARDAYERANRTITRMLEIPNEVTKIQSIAAGSFTGESGWFFCLPKNISVNVGDQAMFYGEGINSPFRGLVIANNEAFYQTEAEQDIDYQRLLKKYKKK